MQAMDFLAELEKVEIVFFVGWQMRRMGVMGTEGCYALELTSKLVILVVVQFVLFVMLFLYF